MTIRTLARSLDPLPDESLVGFLLRLSHRLDITPGRLAVLTGLATGTRRSAIAIHQLRIPPSQAIDFARATRLTSLEVAGLCLDSLRDRYPPLDLDYPAEANFVRRSKKLPGARGWLRTNSSPYCPDCLAGDGSPIQDAHGGSWRKQWRLSLVFACPIHQRLLRTRCPRCHTEALRRSRGMLLPGGKIISHPARCRSAGTPSGAGSPSACAHRLDDPAGLADEPGPETLRYLVDFQRRALRNMRLDQPDTPPDSRGLGQYFYDLFLIMGLIRASWPVAAQLALPQTDRDAITTHVEHQQRQIAQRREDGKRAWDLTRHDGPPDDPHTCAHLLALADHLRPDGGTAPGGKLDVLISAVIGRRSWFRHLQVAGEPCSPELRAITAPHIAAHTPVPRPRRRDEAPPPRQPIPPRQPKPRRQPRPKPPPRPKPQRRPVRPEPVRKDPQSLHRFDHRHVPHYLPEQYIQRLLTLVDDPAMNPKLVHRYASTTVIRIAAECSISAAGRKLGMPPAWAHRACHHVTSWARNHGVQADLDAETNAIVDNLDASATLIDYQQRREALCDWSIPADDWELLIDPLRRAEREASSPSRTDWGPRKRYVVSLLLWAEITRGDYLLAPLYLARTAHPVDHSFVNLFHRTTHQLGYGQVAPDGRGGHIFSLLHALDPYRVRIETAIDSGEPGSG